jgi:hypothetical protein
MRSGSIGDLLASWFSRALECGDDIPKDWLFECTLQQFPWSIECFAQQDTTSMSDSIAVLLIAHGSRRAEANADLVDLATLVQERGVYKTVEIAYLELCEPTIPQGVSHCVQQGAKIILMMPYFLSAGSHVVEDLERYQQEAAERFPDVRFQLCPPLGLDPLMVDLVMTRIAEGSEAVS